MRSPSRTIRTALLPLVVGASLGLSGCQVGRTFFRMDSNAPVPFLGMDLLPKREKKSPTDGVSRFQSQAVSGTGDTIPRQSEPIRMRELPAQPTVSRPQEPRGWSKLLGRAPQSESLVLPAAMTNEATTDAPVEQFR